MKIGYIGIKGLPPKGGAERVVEAIVRRISDDIEMTVYCNRRYTPKNFKMEGVKLIRVPTLKGKYLQPLSLFIFSSVHALLIGNYNIVHVHNIEACFVLPLIILRFKIIATAHGRPYLVNKWGWMSRRILRLLEYFYIFLPNVRTSVSRTFTQYWESKYQRRVYYIPNGVDFRQGISLCEGKAGFRTNSPVINDLKKRSGEYILFSADRIIPVKGCHLLLKVFKELENDVRLLIVGNVTIVPRYYQELLGLADKRVIFIPFIESKDDFFDIIGRALFFVFPSVVEGMSMMLLEAASLGVPIVCSDISANTDVLKDSHALFFRTEDTVDLREKLKWALEHPQEMKEIGKRAQKWVRDQFSWDKIAEKYELLYREVTKKVQS